MWCHIDVWYSIEPLQDSLWSSTLGHQLDGFVLPLYVAAFCLIHAPVWWIWLNTNESKCNLVFLEWEMTTARLLIAYQARQESTTLCSTPKWADSIARMLETNDQRPSFQWKHSEKFQCHIRWTEVRKATWSDHCWNDPVKKSNFLSHNFFEWKYYSGSKKIFNMFVVIQKYMRLNGHGSLLRSQLHCITSIYFYGITIFYRQRPILF